MLFDDFGNLGADGPDRVQRSHGILENCGDLCTADAFPVFICFQLRQILSVKHDGAVGDNAVRLQHAGKSLRKDRFP